MAFQRNGAARSTYDSRDLVLSEADLEPPGHGTEKIAIPWGTWNQGKGGAVPCCVSAAVVTCMEIIDLRTEPSTKLSLLFHYYVARDKPSRMTGMPVRQGMNAAVRVGVCRLDRHQPQSALSHVIQRADARLPPSEKAFEDAKSRCIVGYDPIQYKSSYSRLRDERNVDTWRAVIHAGQPILFVIPVTRSYANLQNSSYVHGPLSGHPIGADLHALVALGYDDDRRQFWVRDSRGPKFCDAGHWWLPYALVRSPWVIEEAWTVTNITY